MAEEIKLNEQEIRDGAGLAALSYVFFLWALAFLFRKDNKFSHFHAKQGLVLFIFEVIVFFFLSFIPFLGALLRVLGLIVFPLCALYGIYAALTGRMSEIPVITDFAKKLVV